MEYNPVAVICVKRVREGIWAFRLYFIDIVGKLDMTLSLNGFFLLMIQMKSGSKKAKSVLLKQIGTWICRI